MLAITYALLPTSAPHYCEQDAVTRGQKTEVHKYTFAVYIMLVITTHI